MRILLGSFLGSVVVHLVFIVVAGIQYREQVNHLFWIDAPKVTEQRVCFAPVTPPPAEKKKAASTLNASVKKTVSVVQEAKKEKKTEHVSATNLSEKKMVTSAESKEQEVTEPLPVKEVKDVQDMVDTVAQNRAASVQPKKFTEHDLAAAHERNELRRMQKKMREKFLAVSAALKKEIGLHWHPPLCDQDDVEAKVCCTVSPRGYLEQASIVESSMVMAYDVSVIKALKKMSFVQELWGKRFLILFKK